MKKGFGHMRGRALCLVFALVLVMALGGCGSPVSSGTAAEVSGSAAEVPGTAAEVSGSAAEATGSSSAEVSASEEKTEALAEAASSGEEKEEKDAAKERSSEAAKEGSSDAAKEGETAGAKEDDVKEETEKEEAASAEEAAPVEEAAPAGEAAPAEEAAPAQPAVTGNGRILFIGDSRTIDMFADSDDPISGMKTGDITVYAMHARGYDYMAGTVDGYGHENFDTLVTWMGANDGGNFNSYAAYYAGLLNEGKKIILCTVGPTDDATLKEWDHPKYENDKMTAFNAALTGWAAANGVKVIDVYSYIAGNVAIDPADGIHYMPRPTSQIWAYITGSL